MQFCYTGSKTLVLGKKLTIKPFEPTIITYIYTIYYTIFF